MSIKELRNSLKTDDSVRKFLRIFESSLSALSVPSVQQELASLHAARKSRSLSSASVTAAKLQDAILVDSYTRSRMVELKVLVHRNSELISSALSAVKKHVLVSFADEVSAVARTKYERDHAIDRVFQNAVHHKAELASLSEEIDLLLRDIDQTSFALRNTAELLKVILDRKDSEF
jgi:hypothetical protein